MVMFAVRSITVGVDGSVAPAIAVFSSLNVDTETSAAADAGAAEATSAAPQAAAMPTTAMPETIRRSRREEAVKRDTDGFSLDIGG